MPTYDINIETPGLDRARAEFNRFGRAAAGAAQATADLTRLTIALSAAYLTTRRRVVSLGASIAGLSPLLKIAGAAFVATTVELNRFLNASEEFGNAERDLANMAAQAGVSVTEFRRLQVAAVLANESVGDFAASMGEFTEAQQAAYDASRDLTVALSSDYTEAAQAYAASVAVLNQASENFRSNFLGIPELTLEVATYLNELRTRAIVLLNNALSNLADDVAEPFNILARQVGILTGFRERTQSAAQAVRDFQQAQLDAIRATRRWGEAISPAQQELDGLVRSLQSIRTEQDQLFGAAEGEAAPLRTTRALVSAQERQLALAQSIAAEADREANLRTDLATIYNQQAGALETLRNDASSTAEEIRAAEIRLAGFAAALASLDEVTVELTPYQELFSEFSGGADATVERLNLLNTAIAEMNEELQGTAEGTDRFDALSLAIAQATGEAMRLGDAIEASKLTPNEVALQEQINEATARRELIISRTLGSVQEARRQLELVGDLTEQWSAELAQIEAQGILTPEDVQRAEDLRNALAGLEGIRLQLDPEQYDIIAEQFRDRVQRGLTDGVYLALGGDVRDGIETFALTLGDAARDALAQKIIEALANSALGATFSGFFNSVFGGILGGIGGGAASAGTGAVGARNIGFRQFGGRVQPGGIYGVGERGPELFVPDTSGTVVPNNQIGGGGNVTINQTIQGGGDSEAERAALAQGVALATRAQIQQQLRDGRL